MALTEGDGLEGREGEEAEGQKGQMKDRNSAPVGEREASEVSA